MEELFSQKIYEKGVEVAKTSEPYRINKSGNLATGKSAIWICGNQTIPEVMELPEIQFSG